MDFPYEYRAEVVGDAVPRASNQQWILIGSLVAAVLAYLLLQSATGSWRGAAVLLLTVPFAAVGALLAAQITGGVLDGGVLTALFVVVALALRQALVLVRRAQAHAGEGSTADAMRRALRETTPPVLLAVLGTAALFLPAAVMAPGAGLELLHPFAVALLVGLISTVAVVLLVVPSLYPALAGLRPLPPPPDAAADEADTAPRSARDLPAPRPEHTSRTEEPATTAGEPAPTPNGAPPTPNGAPPRPNGARPIRTEHAPLENEREAER
jgi:HAE1 family hydrophobic/amphiphilic exporter-1